MGWKEFTEIVSFSMGVSSHDSVNATIPKFYIQIGLDQRCCVKFEHYGELTNT